MSVASLGRMSIEVVPSAEDPSLMNVDIACENRKEVLHGITKPGENVDQFGLRVRSMLKAMLNAEPTVLPQEQSDNKKTWEQMKQNAVQSDNRTGQK